MPNRTSSSLTPPALPEAAYEIRRRLQAARQYVPQTIHDFAARRRSVTLFDQLSTLAGAALDAGYSDEEIDAVGLRVWRSVAHVVKARRSS